MPTIFLSNLKDFNAKAFKGKDGEFSFTSTANIYKPANSKVWKIVGLVFYHTTGLDSNVIIANGNDSSGLGIFQQTVLHIPSATASGYQYFDYSEKNFYVTNDMNLSFSSNDSSKYHHMGVWEFDNQPPPQPTTKPLRVEISQYPMLVKPI